MRNTIGKRQIGAECAEDERTKALLLVAESRWTTLANQAELVAVLNVSPNHSE